MFVWSNWIQGFNVVLDELFLSYQLIAPATSKTISLVCLSVPKIDRHRVRQVIWKPPSHAGKQNDPTIGTDISTRDNKQTSLFDLELWSIKVCVSQGRATALTFTE